MPLLMVFWLKISSPFMEVTKNSKFLIQAKGLGEKVEGNF